MTDYSYDETSAGLELLEVTDLGQGKGTRRVSVDLAGTQRRDSVEEAKGVSIAPQ